MKPVSELRGRIKLETLLATETIALFFDVFSTTQRNVIIG